ncbi:MAG: class I SAM-dependent methyltransferase [Chloroflexi bacterium]|nr:class I SAM-dependent methyltransferase [Chloroflexota bacterium]
MKAFYDAWYRWGNPPWIGEPRSELVRLVEDGTLKPGRAIDLGCGVGDNAIFLARHGFEVTAVDFAPSAVARAQARAREAGVEVDFLVDDLTRLSHVRGEFDLLVDYGTFDDLGAGDREAYVREIVPLAGQGGRFLLWVFEWRLSRRERLFTRLLPFGGLALAPGEAETRFGPWFAIEKIAGGQELPGWPRGWAAYLMERRSVVDA